MPSDAVVVIDFSALQDGDPSEHIQRAFGPDGLGIVAISNIPGYAEARSRLLPLAERLVQLPEDAKRGLEDAESRYSFGWSFGKESLQDGCRDQRKGSFYANPVLDEPTDDPHLQRRYPSYCRPNRWPSQHLPELEPAFKNLGQLIVDVGTKLAEHCDCFVTENLKKTGLALPSTRLAESLLRSKAHKARLLVYLPESGNTAMASPAAAPNERPLWCNWHLDHGSLTGLTCALYSRGGEDCSSPDPGSGLYVRKLSGEEVQVRIPEDCVAFQMGQTMSIMSGGLLCATPHCVKACLPGRGAGVSRSTFAVFMQPMWDEVLAAPPGVLPPPAVKQTWGPWQQQMTFGEFSENTIGGYYGTI